MKIYISSSLINSVHNQNVADALEKSGFEVFLPQRFCPEQLPHEQYSEVIFNQCLEYMKQSDIGLLLGDCYGSDSSWEVGWYGGMRKPIIAFLQVNMRLTQDWMIKGGLDGVITTNPDIHSYLVKSEMLVNRPVQLINTIGELGIEINRLYNSIDTQQLRRFSCVNI